MTTTSTSNVISSDRVEGTAVYSTAGDKLGSIDDLMIDKVSGQVRYAVLEFGGFLGEELVRDLRQDAGAVAGARIGADRAAVLEIEQDGQRIGNDLVRGVVADQSAVDAAVRRRLASGWKLERVDATARSILRAGAYELIRRRDVPAEVAIDEYVEIAKSFFEGPEPGFINAALDAIARDERSA